MVSTLNKLTIWICFILFTLSAIFIQGCKEDKKITKEDAEPEEVTEEVVEEPDREKETIRWVQIQGYITFFAGRVEITDNRNKTKKAAIKSVLRKGYKIKTYDNSMVHVQIGSYIVLKILSDTELAIDTMIQNYKTNLKLDKGSVYTKVTKKLEKSESLVLETPTSTAAIRGTEFLTEYKEEKSSFFVKEGEVALYKSKELVQKRAKPDILVIEGDFAVVDKKQEFKLQKQTEIKKLELEKISYGVEVIPDVKKKKVDFIIDFNNKFQKDEEKHEKKINRKIQDIKNVDNPIVVLELKDGSKFKGFIVEQNEKIIKLDDGTDIITIPKTDIIRREFKE